MHTHKLFFLHIIIKIIVLGVPIVLGAVLLITVTALSVLGAYYLSGLFSGFFYNNFKNCRHLIVLAQDDVETTWHNILNIQKKYNNIKIIVLCKNNYFSKNENSHSFLKDVDFTTPEELSNYVCSNLFFK